MSFSGAKCNQDLLSQQIFTKNMFIFLIYFCICGKIMGLKAEYTPAIRCSL